MYLFLSMRLFICFRAFKQKYLSHIQTQSRELFMSPLSAHVLLLLFSHSIPLCSYEKQENIFFVFDLKFCFWFRLHFSECSVTHVNVMKVLPVAYLTHFIAKIVPMSIKMMYIVFFMIDKRLEYLLITNYWSQLTKNDNLLEKFLPDSCTSSL